MSTTVNERRRFLRFATQLLLGVIGLCLLVPAVVYLWAPLRRKRGGKDREAAFQYLARMTDLPPGEWRLLFLETESENGWEKTTIRRGVWARRNAGGKEAVTVLSPICTHLGCSTLWHADQGQFLCPCHKGAFDADGRKVGGPPPRGLDNLEWEVRDDRLWVRWQEFKTGVAEQVPVRA